VTETISKESFSPEQLSRYSRHIMLSQFGLAGQSRLQFARVLIVGAGGLGNPVGLYLAGAGVGTIGVVDADRVSLSNLHRQVAFATDTVGSSKATCLIDTMRDINPTVAYKLHETFVTGDNVEALIQGYDLVIDGTDNFAARFLLGDACHRKKVPLLHGAVHEFQGQVALFETSTACFRCLYRESPGPDALPACSEAGILNVVAGAVGLLMSSEAVKYLAGLPTPSQGSVLVYDALNQSIRHLSLHKDPECPMCGMESNHDLTNFSAPVANNTDQSKLQSRSVPTNQYSCTSENSNSPGNWEVTVRQAEELIEKGAFVVDVREPYEFEEGHLEGSVLIPLRTLLSALEQGTSATLTQLPSNVPIIAYCKVGARSLHAAAYLQHYGYKNAVSLAGGINSWMHEKKQGV
jgi:adenylyltransferase/sulfurtransferase